MKAMILAAGRGKRMRSLTDHTPKPLLKVGDKSLIEHHLVRLAESGIVDIVINTAYLGEKIHKALGNGAQFGVTIEYSHETQALETAGGIKNALPLLGDEPFLVLNADIWCPFPFHTITLPSMRLAHLVLVDNPTHNPHGDFAFDADQCVPHGEQHLTFSGIGVYSPVLFSEQPNGYAPLAPLLREHIALGHVSAEHFQGTWSDIGTPERLHQLNQTT